jgi:hypothetical protein
MRSGIVVLPGEVGGGPVDEGGDLGLDERPEETDEGADHSDHASKEQRSRPHRR